MRPSRSSYNIRTQRGIKRQCTLTYIFTRGQVCGGRATL
ncbi:unnamed protein product [Ascophyllum nodosum]